MPIRSPSRPARRRAVVVRLPEPPGAETLAEAARRGLSATPKTLPCRYFYDEEGSRLFEQICTLPEYYPTRTEDAILAAHADAMVAGLPRPLAMIELGSGSSTKTRRLIAAALGAYGRLQYLPIDVSPTILEASAEALADEFPTLRIRGYAADYRTALATLAREARRPRLVVFLGSSLGNYETDEAAALLGSVARTLGPDDRLLLGTDLVKDRATLEAAYDDARGVTARFNRNLLARLNRELGADFDPDSFDHRATYRDDLARIEMHLVSRRDQTVRIPAAGLACRFAEGESIHTENSHKYTVAALHDLAARAGLAEEVAWTDRDGLFRVQRWRRSSAG